MKNNSLDLGHCTTAYFDKLPPNSQDWFPNENAKTPSKRNH